MEAVRPATSGLDQGFAALWNFTRQELAPYPGRGTLIARMVVSSVLVMILVMTFRIPGAALAGYYTLLLSRESPRATLNGAAELVLAFGAGTVYVLLSSLFFFGSPVLHLLWVIGSFFLIFFVMRVVRSYSAAAGFGFLIATCIPVWDRPITSETAIELTLWTCGSVALGAGVTVALEYLLSYFQPQDLLTQGLAARWLAVENVLAQLAETGRSTGSARLTQVATVGVSRLRRELLRSGADPMFLERMGAVIALTERIVDLTASLIELPLSLDEASANRLHAAADLLSALRTHRAPAADSVRTLTHKAPGPSGLPLLPEIERDIAMLWEASSGSSDIPREPNLLVQPSVRQSIFLADALHNPDHLRFALQGCLAATMCYVIYSGIDWHGLNTSVATCIVTALSSIGSSRQKQLLRISGAAVGGFVLGMGSQVLLLPHMDSIAEFALLFAAVSALAAWFATGSARISYFGLQIALAFFLINLQEPAFQTSLSIARDRVLGILLGLFVMWIVFDLIGGVRAAEQIMLRYRENLRIMARLQMLSYASDIASLPAKVLSLREKLIANFGVLNAEADAILLETGPERAYDLVLRERILEAQSQLRTLLLLQTALLQYRRQVPIEQLPPNIAHAQQAFDKTVADRLLALAEGRAPLASGSAYESQATQELEHLQREIEKRYSGSGQISPAANAVLSLSRSIVSILDLLTSQPPLPAAPQARHAMR